MGPGRALEPSRPTGHAGPPSGQAADRACSRVSEDAPVPVERSGERRMQAQKNPSLQGESPAQQIDAIISALGDWRGKRLAQLRAIVHSVDSEVVEEIKWKKPSKPEGVPVWSRDGIVCIGEALKNAVR